MPDRRRTTRSESSVETPTGGRRRVSMATSTSTGDAPSRSRREPRSTPPGPSPGPSHAERIRLARERLRARADGLRLPQRTPVEPDQGPATEGKGGGKGARPTSGERIDADTLASQQDYVDPSPRTPYGVLARIDPERYQLAKERAVRGGRTSDRAVEDMTVEELEVEAGIRPPTTGETEAPGPQRDEDLASIGGDALVVVPTSDVDPYTMSPAERARRRARQRREAERMGEPLVPGAREYLETGEDPMVVTDPETGDRVINPEVAGGDLEPRNYVEPEVSDEEGQQFLEGADEAEAAREAERTRRRLLAAAGVSPTQEAHPSGRGSAMGAAQMGSEDLAALPRITSPTGTGGPGVMPTEEASVVRAGLGPFSLEVLGGGRYRVSFPDGRPSVEMDEAGVRQFASRNGLSAQELFNRAAEGRPRGRGAPRPVGQVQLAREMSIGGGMTPEEEQRLRDQGKQTAARQHEFDVARAERQAVEIEQQELLAQTQREHLVRQEEQNRRFTEVMGDRMERFDQSLQELREMRIDPQRHLGTPARRIGAGLLVALGSASARPGEQNQALGIIERQIDRDVQAQMSDMQNMQFATQAELQGVRQVQSIFQDENARDSALRVLHLENVLQQLNPMLLEMGGAEQAAGEALAEQLRRLQAEHMQIAQDAEGRAVRGRIELDLPVMPGQSVDDVTQRGMGQLTGQGPPQGGRRDLRGRARGHRQRRSMPVGPSAEAGPSSVEEDFQRMFGGLADGQGGGLVGAGGQSGTDPNLIVFSQDAYDAHVGEDGAGRAVLSEVASGIESLASLLDEFDALRESVGDNAMLSTFVGGGTEPERQAASIRTRALNHIRELEEMGALQEAEIARLNTRLPDFTRGVGGAAADLLAGDTSRALEVFRQEISDLIRPSSRPIQRLISAGVIPRSPRYVTWAQQRGYIDEDTAREIRTRSAAQRARDRRLRERR